MHVNSPLVTINIAVYNEARRFLKETLGSIRKQTYRNIEVNVYDNASTDETREIIRSEFPEWNLVEGKENIGIWPAIERLLEHTRGTYMIGMTDVELDPHFIERAIQVME